MRVRQVVPQQAVCSSLHIMCVHVPAAANSGNLSYASAFDDVDWKEFLRDSYCMVKGTERQPETSCSVYQAIRKRWKRTILWN